MERSHNRPPDGLRPLHLQTGYLRNPEGSALVSMGETKVICTVSLDEGTPRWLKGSGSGWLTAEYAMLPRATNTRTQRESVAGKISGRTQEISRLIGRSLRAIIDLTVLGERTLTVDCDVIQADGGTRTAAINGAYVALAEAMTRLKARGGMDVWPLTDSVAAVSVGMIDGIPCLDLDYPEDSRAGVDMNVVMTGAGQFIEVQGTAEKGTFDKPGMDRLLELAAKGIAEITGAQKQTIDGIQLTA